MSKIFNTKLSLLFLAMLFAGITLADEIKYTDSWGKEGYTIEQQSTTKAIINYSINNFSISDFQVNGESMKTLELAGHFLPNDAGAPNLPGAGRYIALPQGSNAKLNILSYRTETFTNVTLSPSPRIPWDTETGPLDYSKDLNIYSKDAFYPKEPVLVSEVTQIRGVDVVMLGITPFQYNPVTKELIVYRDLEIQIDFEGGNGYFGDDRLRSRWWDPLLADMLLNYESLPKMNYNNSFQATDDVGCEYLIVTPNNSEFQQWADSIKQFRTLQGISTDIKTLEDIGGNTVTVLENYFNNAYATWDIAPSAVLLLGDYGSNASNTIISPIWDGYCASDNIFADVNNNDMPDMVFARMTAQNAAQLEVMVTKFLDYERNPPTNANFYNHPISALGWQDDRWFQICSEVVGGFWNNALGKETVRINALGSPSGNHSTGPWSTNSNTPIVMNYFGPSGLGYIPGTPQELGGFTGGTGAMVNNAINSGAFMLQHRDHGYEQGWGEPDYSSSDINGLNNTDLCFVWSINCLTGKYNISSEVFAEKFHRYTFDGENSGALGVNAASEVSYSFVNDTYVWGAYDNMWPDFMPDYGTTPEARGILPAFASAAGKYFLQQSSWPYNTNNKEVTYNLFHHHGDAFMTVYSEVPQNLIVTHNPIMFAGVTSFDITANAGAFIALTMNGEIIATAEATGGPVSISIPAQQPPDQMLVTITKQNYYRYESFVEVIPPDGPYVVHYAVDLNDAAGNGNGIMETSESIMASITLENVGIDDAEGVTATISTDNEYVTITDDTEDYGTIAAGATMMMEDGFAWDVANNIPDNHMVIFTIDATDGTETWTTSFSVMGHAPFLEVGTMTIDDSEGNGNGRLDPGETVDIYIETYNTGSFQADEAMASLSSSSGYLTLNSSSFDFNTIGAGLMEQAEFNVTVAGSAPIGTAVSFMYDVVSGGYSAQQTFASSIGLILEDWETGDMGSFDWTTGGAANWEVSTDNPYEGTYCAKSGNINDNQTTWIELDYEVFSDDVVSFYYKVSSEGSYDFLNFYIDGNELGSWSGEVDWAFAEYDVTAGVHTFKWEFDKDYSVSSGSDCGWIDFIVLPAAPMTTAYAGMDASICEGDDYNCEGNATLFNTLDWETSGTGTFVNSQQLDAIYTPSADDIEDGSVTLSLTAYGPDNTVTDEMILTINKAAMANAGEDDTMCSTEPYLLAGATAENYVSVEWATEGDGTFDDDYIINPSYTPGEGDIVAGSVTLTFLVSPGDPCPEVMDDIMLTIEQGASAYAGEDTDACSNMGMELSNAIAENYSTMEWSTAGDGTFDDIAVMNPVYTPGENDASNGEVTLTFAAMGMGTCGEVTAEIMLAVTAGPSAFAGEDNQVDYDQAYTVEDAMAENYSEVTWSTAGDGTFDDVNSMGPTYTPGTNDIENSEVVLTLTAANDDCGEVTDEMTLDISSLGLYENLAGFDVAIFPNPNTGQFSVELNGNSDELINLRIYNAIGEVVYKSDNIKINQSYSQTFNLDVEQGIYYIRLEGENLLLNKKIIIQ